MKFLIYFRKNTKEMQPPTITVPDHASKVLVVPIGTSRTSNWKKLNLIEPYDAPTLSFRSQRDAVRESFHARRPTMC